MESAINFMNYSKATPLVGADEQTIQNDVVWYYILGLGLEVVYMLVRRTFAIKGLKCRHFELGRIGNNILLSWVWSDYSRLLKIALFSNGFYAFLKFTHPHRVIVFIFWTSFFSGWKFKLLKIEVVLTLCFLRSELSPSFCLPLLLLEEALDFGAFDFFFCLSSKSVIIFLRSLINSCWARSILFCTYCTQPCSSNLLATSFGVPTTYAKASIPT